MIRIKFNSEKNNFYNNVLKAHLLKWKASQNKLVSEEELLEELRTFAKRWWKINKLNQEWTKAWDDELNPTLKSWIEAGHFKCFEKPMLDSSEDSSKELVSKSKLLDKLKALNTNRPK